MIADVSPPTVILRGARSAAGRRYGERVILKHYADTALGSTAERAMRAIGGALHDIPDAPLQVPVLHEWSSTSGVLVQSVARGEPVLPLLSTSRRTGVINAVARALACLHTLPVRVGSVAGMREHVRDLIHPHPSLVWYDRPSLRVRIEALLVALHAWREWGPTPGHAARHRSQPIHRDAHARQMFLAAEQVTIVDWDLYARGDPALDVANFAVYVRTHLGRAGMSAEAAFLDAYARLDETVMLRVPAYTALTYLRLVSKAHRTRAGAWSARARTFLERAERALS